MGFRKALTEGNGIYSSHNQCVQAVTGSLLEATCQWEMSHSLSAPGTQQGKVKTSASNNSIKKALSPNTAMGSSLRKRLHVALSVLGGDKVMLKVPD